MVVVAGTGSDGGCVSPVTRKVIEGSQKKPWEPHDASVNCIL